MLITDRETLKLYTAGHRLWQGIPGIEVTARGRAFVSFYSGGTKEQIGNFAIVVTSDGKGGFTDAVLAAYEEGHRCYDPGLWIDPRGRLWFFWACAPDHAVYASVCGNPDAEDLLWSPEFRIGGEVMMNKPTITENGDWLFPIAVWKRGVRAIGAEYDSEDEDRRAFVYRSRDGGNSFEKLGGADVPDRSFDEHMIIEMKDGTLAMFVRTTCGIGVAYSRDGGLTWDGGRDSGLGGPGSRFFIRRLSSGRILLINNAGRRRTDLTAMLSEDEGRTWRYKLLIDGRDNVSYPDAAERNGVIHIVYDRERGAFCESREAALSKAREVLYACVTEEDIIAGKLVSPDSRTGVVVSKLSGFAGDPHGLA